MHHKLMVRDYTVVLGMTYICAPANNRYDLGIKNALVSAGGTGFTFPSCSTVPAYQTGAVYSGSNKVSYQGLVRSALSADLELTICHPGTFGRISGGHRPPPPLTPRVIGFRVRFLSPSSASALLFIYAWQTVSSCQ